MGRHVDGEQELQIIQTMQELGFKVAQKVETQSHTNPAIAGKRLLADNISDLKAQVAANRQGARDLKTLVDRYSSFTEEGETEKEFDEVG